MRHDTIRWLVRRYDTMRIRYGDDADAMRHDTMYDVRYGYGTDTVRHDTIHWLVIMMAPYRLIGSVSLSSFGFEVISRGVIYPVGKCSVLPNV